MKRLLVTTILAVTLPGATAAAQNSDLARFPDFSNASPVEVDVHEGETLYLPPMWYHQVSHPLEGAVTIAVNTWRDQNFMSGSYSTYSLLREAALLTTREA